MTMVSAKYTTRKPYSTKMDEILLEQAAIQRGHLILVNRDHPVKLTEQELDLQPVHHTQGFELDQWEMFLDRACLQQLAALLDACQGMNDIIAVSGYRSKEEQRKIYESTLLERGSLFTALYVARPNESEHQTGLAVDVGERIENVDYISPSFPDSGVCLTFKKLSAEYGFIQRYKEGKETITNIACEPWHFRYVGFPHSMIMEQRNLCLEEYIDFLERHRFGQEHLYFEQGSSIFEIYYVLGQAGLTTVPITNLDRYEVSGTNRSGFVITVCHEKGSVYGDN
ncbi:D-alanyl-D-alanine carboxypeptidase family protein [Paenibacillus sp. SC116]|uniref:D-alanyl-D-alanine carboxypeptidase family protein n=1 Tax=Paenibacillus sp. SC116 TaxID=2968986 RepID=UPI00215A8AE5|nr:D-alanyl-D-alanine carboxypeptidase family protein [Paenibacillus sp. SC116]MCR8845161.1 D-alanyl-D-alanine carboxypeptidase family protein [Paenibacillus sp. SC116]